jgi:hypothetical protein
MFDKIDKRLIYFISFFCFIALAILLDYSYENTLGIVAAFAAFILGIFFLIVNRKLFIGYFLILFFLFDDAHRILMTPASKFHSITTIKVFNLSFLSLLLMLVTFVLVMDVLLKRRINIPSILSPLILLGIIQFVSMIVNQIISGDAISMQWLLGNTVPIVSFLVFFIFSYNQELDATGINKLFTFYWVAALAKLFSFILLLILGRFIIHNGGIVVFSNSSFSFLALFIFAALILFKSKGRSFSKYKYLMGIPVLIALAIGAAFNLQRGGVFVIVFGSLFYLSLYLTFPRKILKLAPKALLFSGLVVSIAFMGMVAFNFDMEKLNRQFTFIGHATTELVTLNFLRGNEDIRYVELVNIFMSNSESVINFFLGKGLCGYFEMNYLPPAERQRLGFGGNLTLSDYSREQIIAQKFYAPHTFFNIFLLRGGILGFSFYLAFCGMMLIFYYRICRRILYKNDFMSLNIMLFGMFLLPWLFLGMPSGFKGNFVMGVLYGLLHLFCTKYLNEGQSQGELKCQNS